MDPDSMADVDDRIEARLARLDDLDVLEPEDEGASTDDLIALLVNAQNNHRAAVRQLDKAKDALARHLQTQGLQRFTL